MRLRWLDDDGVTWRDAPTTSRTNARGDFVSMLRLGADRRPAVDASRRAHGAPARAARRSNERAAPPICSFRKVASRTRRP